MKRKPRRPCLECGAEVKPPQVIYCCKACRVRANNRNYERSAYYRAYYLQRKALKADDIDDSVVRQ